MKELEEVRRSYRELEADSWSGESERVLSSHSLSEAITSSNSF